LGVVGILIFSGLVSSKLAPKEGSFGANLSLVLSVLATIIGIFGGVPGINQTFFSKPRIIADAFLPVVIFDDGYEIRSKFPKFWLAGLVRIHNPGDKDILVTEMRLDGRTQDTSGKYKFPDGKPLLYELHVTGTIDEKDTVIKSHSSAVLRSRFSHFENTEEPGVMHGPMMGGHSVELDQVIFTIYIPSFNQLFKYNEDRIPSVLVDKSSNANLTFSVLFNNELLNIKELLDLHHFSKKEWEDKEHLIRQYNAAVSLKRV